MTEKEGYQLTAMTERWMLASSETNRGPWFTFWNDPVFPFGGGHGLYTIELWERHPNLEAKIFDLSGAVEAINDEIPGAVADQIRTHADDYLTTHSSRVAAPTPAIRPFLRSQPANYQEANLRRTVPQQQHQSRPRSCRCHHLG